MTTALELITGGLRNINALEAGETPQPGDSADALIVLNDLLDSLSTDQDFVYVSGENIIAWTPGQFKYTIGNPVGGTFTGTLVSGSPTISGVTVPSTLVAGGDLSDTLAQVPAGTTVLSFNAIANTVTMSANALSTVSSAEQFTYTVPGNIKLPRPLRITSGYTRITAGVTGIDYWFDCENNMDNYNQIGFKGVAGPWPKLLAYQSTFPLGTIWIYPNPSQAGEVHLFNDLIFTQFTSITQNVNFPQGYSRALKKLLALELCPEWGKNPSMELKRQAKEAREFIKALNATPTPLMRYDSAIVRSQTNDAGWIMSGGFL